MSGQAVITIQDKQWEVGIASTPWELEQGLGGLTELLSGTGMLFDTGWEQIVSVTTVPMLFPIDIAFLSETLVITEVYRNIGPGYLVTTQSPARYFIEVNAGELEGIVPGDTVFLDLLPLEEMPVKTDWISMMSGLAGFLILGTLMVNIASDLTRRAFNEPNENPVLLPQASPGRPTANYEIETDRMGNIIITRSDDPGKDVFLQFESDRAIVYDLLRKGERRDLDAGWKIRIKRSETRASILDELWESSARPQRLPSTVKKPTRHNVSVNAWQERDRLGIWITDNRTDKTIAEWWDEDAREMFEQGWFKPGVPQRTTEKPSRAFVDSVLDYAESVGLLAGGKYAAQTIKDACYWTAVNNSTGEIAESYAPYTSSGRALRGGKSFVSRHWQGLALVEVWRQPGRYSEGLKIEAVASERLTLKTNPSAIATKGKSPPEQPCQSEPKGELEFLPDSPEFLAYTIDDIGYRDRIDSAFLSAIARARGKRS